MNIIESIKKFAQEEGCAVLMTVHQPREQILEMFDSILLLSEGKLVFNGPISGAIRQFESLGYNCPKNTNPSDFFLDIMTIDFRSEELKAQSIDRVKKLQGSYVEQEDLFDDKNKFAEEDAYDGGSKYSNGAMYELMILMRRNFKEVVRDPATLGATFGQAIINMLIIGFVFFRMDTSYAGIQNRIGSLFFICINLTFVCVLYLNLSYT